MKQIPTLLPLVALLGTSCGTTSLHTVKAKSTTYEELISVYGRRQTDCREATVLCTVVNEGSSVTLPQVIVERGRVSRAASTSSAVVPTDFAFPETPHFDNTRQTGPSSPDSFAISPSKPIAFKEQRLGWSLELTLEPRGNFTLVRGTLTHVKKGDMIRAEGIPFRPIEATGRDALGRSVPVIVTENRAERPAVITEEIPIMIAARGNETYRIYLDESHKSYADFHCVLGRREARLSTAKVKVEAPKAVVDDRRTI